MNTLIISMIMASAAVPHHIPESDILFMIEQAVRAPSGHNSQPWIFTPGETGIVLSPDLSKALPVVDPHNRELFIGVGCALEDLCIAAVEKGYLYSTRIDPDGTVTVDLWRSDEPGDNPPNSELFSQIPLRQTNRSIYTGETIPDYLTDELSCVAEGNVKIRFFKNGSQEFEKLRVLVKTGNSLQMKDKRFKGELISWMRFNGKHSLSEMDGLAYDVFGAPDLPRFISKPAITMAVNARAQMKGDDRKIMSASHLVLFTSMSDDIVSWIELGRILQRFSLRSTGMGICHSYMNQPNELPLLTEEMITALGLGREHPAILLRTGYGEPMPYSKRRDVSSFIK